ncbi:hypothetical protein PanWU01x14_243990 [Parasponia andersonii]|uniref:Uncharacterized protein n=1 Tax=Parasponia andersonii TaxID=3476 RepID=A0A2P5BF74_PARAD|nr:hypothetical protein PanWU01x14_243990 [Parasponia andersonii]
MPYSPTTKPRKISLLIRNSHFFKIKVLLVIFEGTKDEPEVFQMAGFYFAEDKDIIEINHGELAKKRFKNLIHQLYKSTRGIAQAKRHHKPFIEAFIRLECCLLFVPGVYANLVISTLEV